MSRWLAVDTLTGQEVILKVTFASVLSGRALERLERETALLADLHSDSVAPLLAWGREGDRVFLVLPRTPGEPLDVRLARGRLSVREVLTLARCLLAGLVEVHGRGVLHRAIKPANIVVDERTPLQRATLVDFGLSRSDRVDLRLQTLPLQAVQYLAPEQAGLLDAPVGPPSDLYSVGIVLYEALAGHAPFAGDTVGEVLRQHLLLQPELRASSVEVPRVLEEVIQRLLQKHPQDRYQSAAAALADVEAIAAGLMQGKEEPAVVIGQTDRRQTLTEPALVARAGELAAMDEVLDRACEGRGGLLLLEGESGTGKTRLLVELRRRALLRGAWVLRGQGVDQSAPKPLQVLSGVFKDVVAQVQADPAFARELRERLGELAGAAARAVPALGQALVGGAGIDSGPEAMGESRTIRALSTVLSALGSAAHPAVVLLDDMQWADEVALKLLQHWSDEQTASRRYVLVALGFRADEVPPGHLLRRLPALRHLSIGPLRKDELRQLVSSMAGALPEEALDLVARLAEGNPFMTSAILRGLVESGVLRSTARGWQVDQVALAEVHSSRQAASFLVRRLRLLEPRTLHLLSVGAVLGREFDVRLAAALAGEDPQRAVVAFEETRRRHILWADPSADRYTFVHDKIREALLRMLDPGERKALHLLAAQQLEASGDHHPFELAYHFDAAGESQRALPHALEAARAARLQYALEVAERHYRIAERGSAMASRELRQQVAEGLGDVLMLRGRYDEAAERLRAARALATGAMAQARTEGKLGELAFKQGDSEAAIAASERALALLGRRVPRRTATLLVRTAQEVLVQTAHTLFPSWFLARRPLQGHEAELLAARLYSRLAYAYWFQRGRLALLWAHLRELNLCERYPATLELAQAYSDHAPAMTLVPMFNRALRFGERSLALRRALGDRWGEGQSLHFYGVALYAASKLQECLERCRQAVRLLEKTGDQWEVNIANTNVALALYRLGDLRRAVAEGRQIVEAAVAIGDRQAKRIGLDVWSKASGGRVPPELIQEEIARPGDDAQSFSEVLQAEGVRLLYAGQPGLAAVVFLRAHEVAREARLQQEYVAPALPWLVTALREEAERVPILAAAKRRRLLRRAARLARQAVRIARTFRNNLAHALRERGLLEAMTGSPRRARRFLDESLQVAQQLDMKHEAARTLLARSRVGLAFGWPGAKEDANFARRQLNAMGADFDVPRSGEGGAEPVTLSLLDRFPKVLEAGRSIASALTREEIFVAVKDAVQGLLRVEQCEIIYPLPTGTEGSAGQPDHDAHVRQAIAAGRPVMSTMGPDDELGSGNGESRSVLCAPIFVRGEAMACFCVTQLQLAGFFGEEEQRLAEFISVLAGAALENAEGFTRIAALSEERGRLFEQAQEALRLRDEFIGIASHELKTPLTALQLHLHGLQTELKRGQKTELDPGKLSTKVTMATSQVRRLARLVETLLDLSQLSRGQLTLREEPVELGALVRDIVDQSREALVRAGCELTLSLSDEPIRGNWDRLRLEQVVSNLLSNAMKYGAGKPIHIVLERDGELARLTVQDYGIGISEENQKRIFERFERAVSVRHYGGFGLGLWIAREIVTAFGGTIHVTSREGEGAAFRVELPLTPPN